jgi:hypothetical protein
MSSQKEFITVTNIEIEPNRCPIEDRIQLNFDFILQDGLNDAYWEFKVKRNIK